MEAKSQKRLAWVIDLLFYTTIIAAVYFAIRYLLSWTLPFFLGTAIAALMRPAALFLSNRLHISERSASILSVLVFYLAAAALLTLFLTILLAQAYELLLRLPELYAQNIAPLLERLGDLFFQLTAKLSPTSTDPHTFYQSASQAVQQSAVEASSKLVGWGAKAAAKLPLFLIASIFTIMISLLTSAGYQQVGHFLQQLIPEHLRERAAGLQTFFRTTVWQVCRAYTILVAITFLQLLAGLWMLNFSYVLPVAACIALLDLLPLIGSGAILVPWAIILLAGQDYIGGIGLLFLFGIIAVTRNILEPKLIGDQIGLHPIATITVMYAGLQILGFWGFFLAPILVMLIRYLLQEQPNVSKNRQSN